MFERSLSPCFVFFLSLALLLSLSLSTCSLSCSSTSVWSEPPRNKTTAHAQNEEYCTVAIHNPLTGYEPNLLDNFDFSETYAAIFQDESSDIDTEPSYSCDSELDDEIIGKALSSSLFIQEREEPANRRQAFHSHEESLLPAQSFFAHTSTGRPEYEPGSSQKTDIRSRHGKRKNQDSPWKTKRENSRWSQDWDPEARISSRVWKKKYPGSNWNYWFSAKGNWSCSCRRGTIQAISITISRTTVRTKSGSSWSSYQKSSCDGRIEESSRITSRWFFEKKIDRKSGHYQWTHGQNSGITGWSQLYEWLERF